MMGKYTRLLLLILIVSNLFGSGLFAQQSISSGKVIYQVSFSSDKYNPEDFQSLPSEITYYFKNNKMRMDFPISSDHQLSTIVNCKRQVVCILSNISGKKTHRKVRRKDVLENLDSKEVLHFDSEKKCEDFIQLPCFSRRTTSNDNEVVYTKHISIDHPNWHTRFSEIDGFLLQFREDKPDYSIEYTAISVVEENVPDSLFRIPSDYKRAK